MEHLFPYHDCISKGKTKQNKTGSAPQGFIFPHGMAPGGIWVDGVQMKLFISVPRSPEKRASILLWNHGLCEMEKGQE